MTESPWIPEQPWRPESTTTNKRSDALSYMSGLDDAQLTQLVTEARSTSKDEAASKVQQILKGGKGIQL